MDEGDLVRDACDDCRLHSDSSGVLVCNVTRLRCLSWLPELAVIGGCEAVVLGAGCLLGSFGAQVPQLPTQAR